MNKKIRWITETAVMLALLVCLQALTKPMGQLVTGSCVNAVLAVSALVGGLICGVLSENLLASGVMKAPMLKALPATFSWPQLITALVGGAVALAIAPVLGKALHK